MSTKLKTPDKNRLSEIDENISKLFDIRKRLGKGAYGIVWKAMDRRSYETVAVKKIFDAFRDETDAQRTFREIVFLKEFRSHPNIIKLHNVFKASNNLDIYLIFEYMESDLHNIIKKGSVLKDIHKRFVMYQLINAIKYIHSGNVIHRDLKPSNVLIDSKCRCKLADFGLARSVSNRPMGNGSDYGADVVVEPLLTDYVATRWYRAPEILVASKRYTKGIDMWSLGCILGEMIQGKPLFQGTSTINQIEKIVSTMPDITEHDINAIGEGFGTALLSKQVTFEKKTSLGEMLIDGPPDAVDLVHSLLVLDPLARLTAKQALSHHYVGKFRNYTEETELNMDILPPFRDDVRLTVPEYRSKLYEIVKAPGSGQTYSRPVAYAKETNKRRDQRKDLLLGEHLDLTKKTSKAQISMAKLITKDHQSLKNERNETEIGQQKSNSVKPIKKFASPGGKCNFHSSTKLHPPTASEKLNGNFQCSTKLHPPTPSEKLNNGSLHSSTKFHPPTPSGKMNGNFHSSTKAHPPSSSEKMNGSLHNSNSKFHPPTPSGKMNGNFHSSTKFHPTSSSEKPNSNFHSSAKLYSSTSSEKVNDISYKGKVHSKHNDQAESDTLKVYPVAKRVSNGNCNISFAPISSKTSPKVLGKNCLRESASRKVDSSDKLPQNYSHTQKMDAAGSHNRKYPRDNSIDHHDRRIRSSTVFESEKRSSIVRNTKSDTIKTPPKEEIICYDKRLKKIEAEIEKYKLQVQKICRNDNESDLRWENHCDAIKSTKTSNTRISHATQTRGGNGIVQNVDLQSNDGDESHSDAIKPTKTSNTRLSHATQTRGGSNSDEPQKSNIPRRISYNQLVAKCKRDFASSEMDFLHCAGGSGDHVRRTAKSSVNNNDHHCQPPPEHSRIRPLSKYI